MSVPHFNGKDCLFKFFINGVSIGELDVKSFNLKPNVTTINDPVCGEKRDRLAVEVNYYEMKVSCFQRDLKKFIAVLADQDLVDDGSVPTDKEFAIVIKPKDGSKSGFQASEAVLDDWTLDVGGRVDRGMLELPIRCRFFKNVPL